METSSGISGVRLEIYKEKRQLTAEDDGYLGKLWSGSVVILAVIDPVSFQTICIFRDGSDNYIKQRDWLNNPITECQQACHAMYLADRNFSDGTQVYGVKVPLRVNELEHINRVHYPENMMLLAQFVQDNEGKPMGEVVIWKIALISQDGDFFVTVEKAYEVKVHLDGVGKLCFPRFRSHDKLQRILVESAPDGTPSLPLSSFEADPKVSADGLGKNEGVVERWYSARNMGCIVTSAGKARVHWSDIEESSGRRCLVEGEKVKFSSLKAPPKNPGTQHRKVRKARFKLQGHTSNACNLNRAFLNIVR